MSDDIIDIQVVTDAHHDDLAVDAGCGVDHWDLISGCDNALVDGGSNWFHSNDIPDALLPASVVGAVAAAGTIGWVAGTRRQAETEVSDPYDPSEPLVIAE
jgi:hypothetical protein